MSNEEPAGSLESLEYLEDGRRVSFVLTESLYPREAIFGAAYLFLDRAFVFLSRPDDGQVEVRLTPKEPPEGEQQLVALAGEFANALLDQVVRLQVAQSTGSIREYYISRAFFTSPAQSSIDALLAELDDEELEDDDLEISVPWESEDDGG